MSDLLLQTVSTFGRMSIENFDSAFNIVYKLAGMPGGEVDLHNVKRQTIRFLDSLGHCEFDFDRREVFACPPTLISIPTCGLPKAILTGARIPSTVQKIKDFIRTNRNSISYKIELHGVSHLLLPSAIYIEAIDYECLKKVAQAAQISYDFAIPAAWSLVNFSEGIDKIRKEIRYEDKGDLDWQKRTFFTDTLTFSRSHNADKLQELVSYINPVSQQRLHWIWNGNMAAEVDRDWGRYIVLSEKRMNVILYDERRYKLVVPSTVPLPRFLARAATMCTGLAPLPTKIGAKSIGGIPAEHPIDIYAAIPPAIAKMISKKLSQELIPYNVVLDRNGVVS